MALFGYPLRLPMAALAALVGIAICNPSVGFAQDLGDLAAVRANVKALQHAFKSSEAFDVAKQAMELAEKKFGPDHVELAPWIDIAADANKWVYKYEVADALYKRSLQIRETSLGAGHPDVALSLNNLALLNFAQRKNAEAEAYYLRGLSICEAAVGPKDAMVAGLLNTVALFYESIERHADARPLRERSVAIYEAAGSDEAAFATALNDLAVEYQWAGRFEEAVPLHRRAQAIYKRTLGINHPNVATSLNNLAELHRRQSHFAEAEPLYRSAIAIYETALGREHEAVKTTLYNLAELLDTQGRREEADAILDQSHKIRDVLLSIRSAEKAVVTKSFDELEQPLRTEGNFASADRVYSMYLHLRSAQSNRVGISVRKTARGEYDRQQSLNFVKVVWLVAAYGRDDSKLRETFTTAQWGYASSAADSLALMAARAANADLALAALVRERQDFPGEQERDSQQTDRLNEIDNRIRKEFPEYSNLTDPQPLSVADAQALLGANEALVLIVVTPKSQTIKEETFVWVVTQSAARWVHSDLGTEALTTEVAALRCGLDAGLWEDAAEARRCRDLVAAEPKRDAAGTIQTETLPFDTTRAHALYKALFGEVEDLIRGKHLLVVPTGPLTQLPLQALVTSPSANAANYKDVAWFARGNAVTMLPAVSSLQALRRVAKPIGARKPMVSFGNPLLNGDPTERPWETQWAALARKKQACSGLPYQQVAQAGHKVRGVLSIGKREGRADLAHLRALTPLPDTVDEVCAIAKDLKIGRDDIWLGARATETNIKALSANGKLAQYRAVHFATHGAVAGEISGSNEPGLILTPPAEASDTDDGYLSASEVSTLKLDADWVILSACNTAAGGAQGAEALSGLAQAFLYAGARSLLVSHWAVDSAATVKLITEAVGGISRDANIGRAEALRRAMLAMIDKGPAYEAHPAIWAPFVVIGEGRAR